MNKKESGVRGKLGGGRGHMSWGFGGCKEFGLQFRENGKLLEMLKQECGLVKLTFLMDHFYLLNLALLSYS